MTPEEARRLYPHDAICETDEPYRIGEVLRIEAHCIVVKWLYPVEVFEHPILFRDCENIRRIQ
jgi:hypothetical protein